MKKTIARLITLILTAALLITFVVVTPVNAATTPKSAATKDEETIDYKIALKDLAAGIKARNKILIDDGTLSEAFKAEYEAVADYEEAKYGGGPLLDFLANSCVASLKQIASAADLSELEEEEQKELQPYIESEIRTYLTIVDILEKKFDVEIDDFELPEVEDTGSKKETADKDVKETNTSKTKTSAKSSSSTQKITLEPFTPIDNDECTVTIKDIDPDNMWGYTVKTELENKSSDKTLMFSIEAASVNGVEADPFFATEIAPGKKANKDISFSDSKLKENGITDFTDIEIVFHVYDSEDWSADDIARETFHVYPYGEDKATAFVREQQDTDLVLVDDDNITVIITDKGDDPIWGYTLDLFIENKTDAELMVSVDEASVNGYMADPFFAKSVQPGKCAFTSMSWSYSSLEDSGITDISDIEEIEFKLRAYDYDNWDKKDYFSEVVTVEP